jgi:hypothetical protein
MIEISFTRDSISTSLFKSCFSKTLAANILPEALHLAE